MVRFLTALLAIVVAAIAGALMYVYSGIHYVGADMPHDSVSQWLLSAASRSSIERHAREVEVPDLNVLELRLAGANDFKAMCAACHGAPGKKPDSIGRGLNPSAPDLALSAARMTPAQLFWVTKHGIKMTGMPAWGATHSDAELWPVVAFMLTLPDLSPDDYDALLGRAIGIGHHATEPGSAPSADSRGKHNHADHEH